VHLKIVAQAIDLAGGDSWPDVGPMKSSTSPARRPAIRIFSISSAVFMCIGIRIPGVVGFREKAQE